MLRDDREIHVEQDREEYHHYPSHVSSILTPYLYEKQLSCIVTEYTHSNPVDRFLRESPSHSIHIMYSENRFDVRFFTSPVCWYSSANNGINRRTFFEDTFIRAAPPMYANTPYFFEMSYEEYILTKFRDAMEIECDIYNGEFIVRVQDNQIEIRVRDENDEDPIPGKKVGEGLTFVTAVEEFHSHTIPKSWLIIASKEPYRVLL